MVGNVRWLQLPSVAPWVNLGHILAWADCMCHIICIGYGTQERCVPHCWKDVSQSPKSLQRYVTVSHIPAKMFHSVPHPYKYVSQCPTFLQRCVTLSHIPAKMCHSVPHPCQDVSQCSTSLPRCVTVFHIPAKIWHSVPHPCQAWSPSVQQLRKINVFLFGTAGIICHNLADFKQKKYF